VGNNQTAIEVMGIDNREIMGIGVKQLFTRHFKKRYFDR